MQDSTTTELVTPDMAREWRANNTTNRPIRPRHVAMLARAMQEEKWEQNGQPIIFADTERLLDGQHRLEAVILADVPVMMDIRRGIKESAFHTLDQGLKRTAADDLRAMGVLHATRSAAAARLVLMWTKGISPKTGNVSKSEITDFVIANPEIAEYVGAVAPAKKAIPTSGLTACYWMAQQTNDPNLDRRMACFITGLATGADLTLGSPILTLRNSGQSLRKGASMSTEGWFGLTLQAWNAFASGEQRKVFKSMNWPDKVAGYPHKRMAVADPNGVHNPQRAAAA